METVWLLQVQGVTSEILGREAFKLCSHTKLKSKAKSSNGNQDNKSSIYKNNIFSRALSKHSI